MNLLKYLFLAFIQGITEPIPVSSSGHLILLNKILNLENFSDLNFEIITNFGSLIAIVLFYRKEIFKIIQEFFLYIKTKDNKYKTNYNYSWMIVIGVIPIGLIGFVLKDYIDNITSCKIVGISLLITAFLLFITKKINGKKKKEDMTFKDSIFIGLFSIISLIPGISRSGATITPGLIRKLDKETAFNYSFMLYIPVSIASLLLGILDFLKQDNISELILPYFLGMLVSCIFTYITIRWFKKIIENGKINIFIYYCIIVGTIALLFL